MLPISTLSRTASFLFSPPLLEQIKAEIQKLYLETWDFHTTHHSIPLWRYRKLVIGLDIQALNVQLLRLLFEQAAQVHNELSTNWNIRSDLIVVPHNYILQLTALSDKPLDNIEEEEKCVAIQYIVPSSVTHSVTEDIDRIYTHALALLNSHHDTSIKIELSFGREGGNLGAMGLQQLLFAQVARKIDKETDHKALAERFFAHISLTIYRNNERDGPTEIIPLVASLL